MSQEEDYIALEDIDDDFIPLDNIAPASKPAQKEAVKSPGGNSRFGKFAKEPVNATQQRSPASPGQNIQRTQGKKTSAKSPPASSHWLPSTGPPLSKLTGKKSRHFEKPASGEGQRQGVLNFASVRHSDSPGKPALKTQSSETSSHKPARPNRKLDREPSPVEIPDSPVEKTADALEECEPTQAIKVGETVRPSPKKRRKQDGQSNAEAFDVDKWEIHSSQENGWEAKKVGVGDQQPARQPHQAKQSTRQAKKANATSSAANRGRKAKQKAETSEDEYLPSGQWSNTSGSTKRVLKRLKRADEQEPKQIIPECLLNPGSIKAPSPADDQVPDSRQSSDPATPSGQQQLTEVPSVQQLQAMDDAELVQALPTLRFTPEELSTCDDVLRQIYITNARYELLEKRKMERGVFRTTLEAKMRENRAKKDGSPQQASPINLSPGCTPNGKHQSPDLSDGKESTPEEHRDVRIATWEPPPSNFFLIEEMLYNDPWRLLTACMLLNKTSGNQVRKIMWDLFRLCPTPEDGRDADVAAVEKIIHPLGLHRKRAVIFKRFCQEYLEKEWKQPWELHGIGQYATDAYHLFCRGNWRSMSAPQDKDLLMYYKFLVETDGQGKGFEREVFDSFSSSPTQ